MKSSVINLTVYNRQTDRQSDHATLHSVAPSTSCIVLGPVHTVAEKCDCRMQKTATVAEFGDSLTFQRQCGQGFTYNSKIVHLESHLTMHRTIGLTGYIGSPFSNPVSPIVRCIVKCITGSRVHCTGSD